MRHVLISFAVLSVTACGPELSTPVSFDSGVTEQPLLTDPWQHIFAVYKSGASFVFNPLGTMSLTCPDGVFRSECTVSRFNMARTGLSLSQQQALLTRINAEPSAEGSASVAVKGQFVSVRDNRTTPPQSWVEFRLEAAYWAPAPRAHSTAVLYVAGPAVGGFRPVRSLNADLLPRGITIPFAAQLGWVGPSGQAPSSYPADSFISVTAIRPLTGGGGEGLGSGPFEMDVDQRFTRVPN
jgi:hypothetical protein